MVSVRNVIIGLNWLEVERLRDSRLQFFPLGIRRGLFQQFHVFGQIIE